MFSFLNHVMRYFIAPDLQPVYNENKQIVGYTPVSSSVSVHGPISSPTVQYTRTSDGHFIPVTANIPSGSIQPTSGHHATKWDGWPDGNFSQDFTHEEAKISGNLCWHWAFRANGGYRNGDVNANVWEKGKKYAKKCLGVIQCKNPDCRIVFRVATAPERVARQLTKDCECGSSVYHHKCDVVGYTWIWRGGQHYENSGDHFHPRPGQVLHILPEEKARFNEVVKTHPQSKPLNLITGPTELGGPGDSVAKISDVFLNADRVGKERLKLIKSVNMSNGDAFIASFAQFCHTHPDFVIQSNFGEVTVICFQSHLMRQQLFKGGVLEGSVNGMVNDAAHGWWKVRTSLLMVTSTYSPTLHSWIPGVFSYTNGASATHFKIHFRAVFDSIADEANLQSHPITDVLFAGMMDFSEAERKGFIDAFTEFWLVRPGNTRNEDVLNAAGQRLLKGCQEHFRAGVTRVSRISAVVPPGEKEYFVARALALLNAPNSEEFQSRAALITSRYPNLKAWIDWWTRPAHAMMLFSSERLMDEDLWDSLPTTNNAEEAMHWKLYCAYGRDHNFMDGMAGLYAVSEYYEQMYKASKKGIRIRYGDPEPWKYLASLTGRTKSSRSQDPAINKRKHTDGRAPDTAQEIFKKPRRHKFISDGRPPDTKKALRLNTKKALQLNTKKALRLKTAQLKKRVIRHKTARASLLKPQFQTHPPTSTAESEQYSISVDHSSDNNIPTHQVPPPSELGHYQSYKWSNNSCWLDTSLELLYIALSNAGLEELSSICLNVPNQSALLTLHKALKDRSDLIHNAPNLDPNVVSQHLTLQRDNLRKELHKRKIIQRVNDYESLYVWVSQLARLDSAIPKCTRLVNYFQTLVIDILECSGGPESGGKRHVQITSIPRRKVDIQIERDGPQYTRFKGNISKYLENFFAIDRRAITHPYGCWRVRDGIPQCSGERTDLHDIVISIPVILTIELTGSPSDNYPYNHWLFPTSILPLANTHKADTGLIYDKVGYAILTANETHFTACYISGENNYQHIYAYDGRKNGGQPQQLPISSLDAPMVPGDHLIQAFYYLRGGIKAQDTFINIRAEEVRQKHATNITTTDLFLPISVVCTANDLQLLDPKLRAWMRDPYRANTAEYVSKSVAWAPQSPRGKIVESEDELEPGRNEESNSREPSADNLSLGPGRNEESNSQEPSADNLSLPDSLFDLNCRCGITGDGNILYNVEDVGEAIQCDECKSWSHIACQRDGRASDLLANTQFVCDFCDLSSNTAFASLYLDETRKQKHLQDSKDATKELHQRLTIGRGALSRIGEFWYPVHLIHKVEGTESWRVRWWSECTFAETGVYPGSVSTVLQVDIVDSLWRERKERRKIRLGRWTHANDVAMTEDILSNPSLTPFSDEVDTALAPSQKILCKLLVDPSGKTGSRKVPAKAWLRKEKKSLTKTLVPFASSLTIQERSMILNWFEVIVCDGDQALRNNWIGFLPLAHAYTIFIAHRLKTKDSKNKLTANELLDKAWAIQFSGTVADLKLDIDVNKESLARLEELMFERSARAGRAGNYQWGLDAGDHQDCWDVYSGLPEHWDVGDRVSESEGELERGADYQYTQPRAVDTLKPRPRPRKKASTNIIIQ